MKAAFLGTYRRDEGYNGRTIDAKLCLINGYLFEVYPFGFIPCAALNTFVGFDAQRALDFLETDLTALLLDHIIVGGGESISLAERGLI